MQLADELDEEYDDILTKLDFSRKKDGLSNNAAAAQAEVKGKDFDNFYGSLKMDLKTKAQPVKQELTENEQA